MFKENPPSEFAPKEAASYLIRAFHNALEPIYSNASNIHRFTASDGSRWETGSSQSTIIIVSTKGIDRQISEFTLSGNVLHHVEGTIIVRHEGEIGHEEMVLETFVSGETHTGWQDAAHEISKHIKRLGEAVQSKSNSL